jgi:prephenate dehydrogenase
VTIGLIGYGRFGRLAARYLAARTRVFVYDTRRVTPRPGRRIVPSSLAVAASQPVVLLAVPVSSLRAVLRDIRAHVRPGALVIDVCAAKALPAQWMKRILPREVMIIGAHPLFGPDSASLSLRGQTAVLCRVRCPLRLFSSVKALLRKEGITVLSMSPDRHDRLSAETIFLTQELGRTVGRARLRQWRVATRSYRELMALVEIARHDSFELFRDMFTYNRHARRLHASLVRALGRIGKDLR